MSDNDNTAEAAPLDPKGESCANCHYARFVRPQPGQPLDFGVRECHLEPPKVFVVNVPVANSHNRQVGIVPQVHTVWPRCEADNWCGKWKPKEE